MKKDEKFFTESLRLATFLFCKKQVVIGINPSIKDRNKKEVVFVKTPELEELVDAYNFGPEENDTLKVDARVYEIVRQGLLEKFNQISY